MHLHMTCLLYCSVLSLTVAIAVSLLHYFCVVTNFIVLFYGNQCSCENVSTSSPAYTVRLRNDLYCVEWGVKLYFYQQSSIYSSHEFCTSLRVIKQLPVFLNYAISVIVNCNFNQRFLVSNTMNNAVYYNCPNVKWCTFTTNEHLFI